MGVQDRRAAVVASHADRRVVIYAVAVPVEVDRIAPEQVGIAGIHEIAVILKMRDLLHDIDPCHTVFVPDGILLETARIQALGYKVGAVSASSFVAVVRRIVINAVFIRICDRRRYIVVVGLRRGRSHHFFAAIFRDDPHIVISGRLCFRGIFRFLIHPVKILIRVGYRDEVPAAVPVTVDDKREVIAICSRINDVRCFRSIAHGHPLVDVQHGGVSGRAASRHLDPGDHRVDRIGCGHHIGSELSLPVPLRDDIRGKIRRFVIVTGYISALGRLIELQVIDQALRLFADVLFDRREIGIHLLRGCDDLFIRYGHGIVIEVPDRTVKVSRPFRGALRPVRCAAHIVHCRFCVRF